MALISSIRGFTGWVDDEQMLNFLTYAIGDAGDAGDASIPCVPSGVQQINLKSMNRKELLPQAKERGIKNVSQMSKSDLLTTIESRPFTGVATTVPIKKRMTKIEKENKAATKQMKFVESSQELVNEFPGITSQIKDKSIDAAAIGYRKLQTISKLLKINCFKSNADKMLTDIQQHLEENPDTIIELNVEEISQTQTQVEPESTESTEESESAAEEPESPALIEPESPAVNEPETQSNKTATAQKRPKMRGAKPPMKKVLEDDESPPAELPSIVNFGCLIQSSDADSDSD